MTLEGPRVFDQSLQGLTCETDDTGIIVNRSGAGWLALTDYVAVQRDYFDLSGYNMDSLTTFFQGVDMQYAGHLIQVNLKSWKSLNILRLNISMMPN